MIAWKIRYRYVFNYHTGRTPLEKTEVVLTHSEDVKEVGEVFGEFAMRPQIECAYILAAERVGEVLNAPANIGAGKGGL